MPNETKSRGPVIVALGYGLAGADLVRFGSAIARDSGAEMECLTIDTGIRLSAEGAERLAEVQVLARSLGAAIEQAPAIDVASGLCKEARERGASAIVLGRGRRSVLARSLTDRLLSSGLPCPIITIGSHGGQGPRPAGPEKFASEGSAGQFLAAALVIAAVTGLNLALASYAGYWAAAITYLAAISISALFLGRRPVLLAAVLSAVAWDYLFIPPRFTMFITRTEDMLMLALYVLVALCSGWMTSKLRASERLLAVRESRLYRLNRLASTLAGADTLGMILDKGLEAIKETFHAEAIAILREGNGGLRDQAESGWEPLDAGAREAALLSFEEGRGTGRHTGIHPESEWHFVPMEGPRGCLGVVGLRTARDAAWNPELESFLRTMVLSLSNAAARGMSGAESDFSEPGS